MIEVNKIEQLLTAFYNGDTTPEEDELLAQFFNREQKSEKWETDRDLFNAIYDLSRIPLPEGFSKRLERSIDNHIQTTATWKSNSKRRKLVLSLLSTAAAVILCIGLFVYTGRNRQQDFISDTYTNPEEAAIAAEQTLRFISLKLNQGLAPLQKVKENLNKTNEILNQNLKLY